MHRLYETNDIVVFWNSGKCRHAKKCVTGSPQTFDITRRPWIDVTIAPTAEIWQTVSSCPITVRNRNSIRPYQHVLEPLSAYLLIAAEQYKNETLSGYYNVGPYEGDCITTGKLVDYFVEFWSNNTRWIDQQDDGPYESNYLKLLVQR